MAGCGVPSAFGFAGTVVAGGSADLALLLQAAKRIVNAVARLAPTTRPLDFEPVMLGST
jgi:hypothetical protein